MRKLKTSEGLSCCKWVGSALGASQEPSGMPSSLTPSCVIGLTYCTLQACLFLPDRHAWGWERPREGSEPDPKEALVMVYLVIITITVSWLSCPCMFACGPTCAPPLSCQPTMRVTPVPQGTLGTAPAQSSLPRLPLSVEHPTDSRSACVTGRRWGAAGLCPQLTLLSLSCSFLHLPSLLMELIYKSWKPKPP